MPKLRRPENIGLPARWRFQHGSYFYQVPPGQESAWDGKRSFLLGKSLTEAYRSWSQKLTSLERATFIGQLLDRYALEVIPTKARSGHKRDLRSVKELRTTFGQMFLGSIVPSDIYKYVDKRKNKMIIKPGKTKGGLSAAKHEIALLSHAFTKAVEWGYLNKHPFKGEVRLEGSPPRTRYVEDSEIVECLSLKSKRKKGSILAIQAYIRIKLLTGLSQADLLRIQPGRQFQDDGIHVQRRKIAKRVGKRTIYEWTPELRAAVKDAMKARPVNIAPYLFCNKFGQCYIDEETTEATGWNSMWQRFMDRVLIETKVTEPFTETDLRAKCASDANSLEHARALLSHVDSRTTNKVYRRKPERVTPVR